MNPIVSVAIGHSIVQVDCKTSIVRTIIVATTDNGETANPAEGGRRRTTPEAQADSPRETHSISLY